MARLYGPLTFIRDFINSKTAVRPRCSTENTQHAQVNTALFVLRSNVSFVALEGNNETEYI